MTHIACWGAVITTKDGNLRRHQVMHFFPEDDIWSICEAIELVTSKSKHRKNRFYSEPEIKDNNLHLCTDCSRILLGLNKLKKSNIIPWNSRQRIISVSKRLKKKVKKSFQKSKFVQTICPGCGSDVIFWNEKKKEEHYCTICEKLVILPMAVIA